MNKLLISVIIMFSLPVLAQKDSLQNRVFKFSPLQIFDLDNTISVGLETRTKGRESIQIEAGYGNSTFNLWQNVFYSQAEANEFAGIHIFKARSEYRWYFRTNPTSQLKNKYFGFEVFAKHTRGGQEVSIGRNPIANVASYSELVDGFSTKSVVAGHFKMGYQSALLTYLPQHNNNWIFDVFGGLGLRFTKKEFIYDNARENDIIPWRIKRTIGTNTRKPEGKWLPMISATFGVKVGFLF